MVTEDFGWNPRPVNVEYNAGMVGWSEYFGQLNKALSPGISRWWKRTGLWLVAIAVIGQLASHASTIYSLINGMAHQGGMGSISDTLRMVGYIGSTVSMLFYTGIWLEIAHLCRVMVRKLYEQTAAPALKDGNSAPVLLVTTFWQGRWLILAALLMSAVTSVLYYLYFGLSDYVRYLGQYPPGYFVEMLFSQAANLLASTLWFITIYLLLRRRRYIWVMLIVSILPTAVVVLMGAGYQPQGGSSALVEIDYTRWGVGILSLVVFALLPAGLAWGRRFLGWVLYGLVLAGSLSTLVSYNVWAEVAYPATHWVTRTAQALQQIAYSQTSFWSSLIWQRGAFAVKIMGTGLELQCADVTTGVVVSTLINIARLLLLFAFAYFVLLQWIPAVSSTAPDDRLPRSKRRRLLIRLGLTAVIATLLTWQMIPCGYTRPVIGRFPPAPDAVAPQVFVGRARTALLADQRSVAINIGNALNEYYADKAEYPPYLIGGGRGYNPGNGWWDTGADRPRYSDGEKQLLSSQPNPKVPDELRKMDEARLASSGSNPDPLIRGNYLFLYPQAYSQITKLNRFPDLELPVGPESWSCMFSTPGDHLVTGGPGPMLYDAILRPEGVRTPVETQRVLAGLDEADYTDVRHLALGGRREWHFPLRFDSYYSLFPREDAKQVEALYSGTHPLRDVLGMPYFGYQRGEWLDGDEREAWLWVYGTNVWSAGSEGVEADQWDLAGNQENHDPLLVDYADFARRKPLRGLDILNARTGELVPDGIPDGICVLYKLRDGAVVEVIEAEDI